MWVSPQQDGIDHAHGEYIGGRIRHISDLLRHFLHGILFSILSVYEDRSSSGLEDTVYAVNEGGLAHPVRAQDGDQLRPLIADCDILQNVLARV